MVGDNGEKTNGQREGIGHGAEYLGGGVGTCPGGETCDRDERRDTVCCAARAELIYLLCHDDGNEALVEMPPEATPEEAPTTFEWAALPPDVLRVLRAGSVLGATLVHSRP
jgi:hypothetical protein